MKKLLFTFVALSFCCVAYSQGVWDFKGKGALRRHSSVPFESENAYITAQPKISHFYHIKDKFGQKSGFAYGFMPSINVAFWEHIDLGFEFGISGNKNKSLPYEQAKLSYFHLGFSGNFHFLKLIDEFSEKLDIRTLDLYFGVNLGIGYGIHSKQPFTGEEIRSDFGFLYGGAHIGLRWYPYQGDVGLITEIGYGKSIFSIGAVFKY